MPAASGACTVSAAAFGNLALFLPPTRGNSLRQFEELILANTCYSFVFSRGAWLSIPKSDAPKITGRRGRGTRTENSGLVVTAAIPPGSTLNTTQTNPLPTANSRRPFLSLSFYLSLSLWCLHHQYDKDAG